MVGVEGGWLQARRLGDEAFYLVGLYVAIRGTEDGSRRDGVWRVMGAIHILSISDDQGWV